MIEKLQFKEKGSLLALKDLTLASYQMLSQLQVLQVTNPLEMYPTFTSSRRAQVTVLHCSIVRNINSLLHISVHPNVDGQEGLYYYIIHSVHCSAGNNVLIEDNFQGIVK